MEANEGATPAVAAAAKKRRNPNGEIAVPARGEFLFCARTHYAQLNVVEKYADDAHKEKAMGWLGLTDYDHPLSYAGGEQRDMQGFGCRGLATFPNFNASINSANTLQLFDHPALAISMFNYLTPVIYGLPVSQLLEIITSDIPGLASLCGFVYSTGYVPANVPPDRIKNLKEGTVAGIDKR